MDSADWALRSDGKIECCPVTGWQAASAAGMFVWLRIGFFRSEQQMEENRPNFEQLAMTPAQALELAEDLRQRAEMALRPATGPSGQN